MPDADWTFDLRLDALGLACPLPVLKARKALEGLAAGKRLLVEASDPVAAIDIPHFCQESGHRLIREDRSGRVWRFLIERS